MTGKHPNISSKISVFVATKNAAKCSNSYQSIDESVDCFNVKAIGWVWEQYQRGFDLPEEELLSALVQA